MQESLVVKYSPDSPGYSLLESVQTLFSQPIYFQSISYSEEETAGLSDSIRIEHLIGDYGFSHTFSASEDINYIIAMTQQLRALAILRHIRSKISSCI